MAYSNQRARFSTLCGACILASAIWLVPLQAQAGFFDQLFGGGAPEPAQPSYGYDRQPDLSPDLGTPVDVPKARKKAAAREVAPVRQKTTDLMHDTTLHVGDAVMMKDGLHIYNGGGSKHTAKQFVPIDSKRSVSSKTRAALLAMDTTRVDPFKKDKSSDTVATGRSAAVGTPISKGFKITDSRGNSVRHVGP